MCLTALLAFAPHAAADPLPRPEQIATPAERDALRQLFALISAGADVRRTPLAALDEVLRRTDGPTPLRGMVQYFRAGALLEANRGRDAAATIEESIALLPQYSGPLMRGAIIEAYNDRPGVAADYLLRAAALDPEWVRRFDDRELDNIVERLRQQHDDRRVRLLAARLFEIGWHGGDLSLRSALARDLIKARVADGDLAGARALLPNLALPAHARQLLIGLDYRALWPDIENWVGPRQSRQWRSYLFETRARWQASRDPRLAIPYARALTAARHEATLVRELLPLLKRPLDPVRDYLLIWTIAPVANALTHQGRWDEADALLAHMLEIWPLGTDANAINLAGNRARILLYRGRAQEALTAIDAVIADAARWGGAVSTVPMAGIHYVRACALHRLGRGGEALSSAVFAANGTVETAVSLYTCLERPEAARTVLIDALAQERLRGEVADLLQIDDAGRDPESLSRLLAGGLEALRNDPALRAAVGRDARILPYSASAGAPPEIAAP